MGKLTALLLAGTVACGVAGSVKAADLPPPPAFEPAPVEPVEFGGWYIRGDVGVGITSKPEIRSSFDAGSSVPDARFDTQRLSDSAFVGAGFGYAFNHWLRADVTGEYRTAQEIDAIESYNATAFASAPGRGYDKYSGHLQSSVFLANGYIDIGTWYGITPFVGVGVGGSYNRLYGLTDTGVNGPNNFGVGGFGYAADKSDFSLAYAAHAGLSYAVSQNLKLELAYRYLNMGDMKSAAIICQNTTSCSHEVQKYKLEAQDVRLGMRWMFSDIAPVDTYAPLPPPPLPLVRKD